MAYQGGYPQPQYGGGYGQHPAAAAGYGQHPAAAAGYGAYAPPPQQPAVNPEIQNIFRNIDKDNTGRINNRELQQALINGRGDHFSDTACNLMISMFDRNKVGTVDIYDFEKLYNYINQWLQVFKNFDRDASGHIEESELTQALTQMGFRFSPQFIQYLITKNDPVNRKEISVDQFIVTCIQIQRFTDAFRVRDTEQKGVITIGFEDFLGIALSMCS
ncbi:AGAP006246-PA-like protein [Anopheles sinensis]|uniref:AGAP006246-PA-like protein n=1 Tax=Anopheles sinensis TaxID=74873 RepID=A0A084VDH1_ANOSI|nr:AGAP006246-PA-like protein [Anopheles sinensis]